MSKWLRLCWPVMIIALTVVLPSGNGQAQTSNTKPKPAKVTDRNLAAYQAQIEATRRQIQAFEKILKQSDFVVKFNPDGSYTLSTLAEIETILQTQLRALVQQRRIRNQQGVDAFRERTFASIKQLDETNRQQMQAHIGSLKNRITGLEGLLSSAGKPVGSQNGAAKAPKRPVTKGHGLMGYKRIVNSAIHGHDVTQIVKATPADCARACDQKKWCVSFDYNKYKKACALSNKRARDVGGLRNTYPMNPYDHYEKR